ncbi:alpha/beta fold hydrolase [Paenibacillus sp. D51F]
MSDRSLATRKLTLSNGTELAYRDNGGAAGQEDVLVLLHGFCGSSAYWEKVLPILEKRYRVLTPDLRGHGGSSGAREAVLGMEELAEDVAALLDALEIGPAVVLGHSLGGYAALALAERHAALLKGFALVHSTPLPDSAEAQAGRDKAAAALRSDGIKPFVDGLVPKLFAPERAESELAVRAKEIGYGTSAESAAAVALGMKARSDRSGVVEQSELPVLLVAGAKDGVIPPERVFAARGSRSSTIVLEGSGHMGMMEAPEKLAEAIDDWMRESFPASE